jgi:hypothetical protein
MSEIKVNKISPRSGTTVTLGDSGDTFTIPAGATINNQGTATNFGATGSASWTTTVKTGDFTAVAGEGYFVDTSSGDVDVSLPAGTAGAVVAIADYANNFGSNKVTLIQNGSDKIAGSTVNAIIDTDGIAITLIFIDSTKGWIVTDDGNQSSASTAQFVTATGGTITTSGNFKIHAFTGPGTFCVSSAGNPSGSNTVDYLVVGGGGSGAGNGSGGAGGGGFRLGSNEPGKPGLAAAALTITASPFPITVGAGGSVGPACSALPSGSPSTFSSFTAAGGGGGGAAGGPTCNHAGRPGGSGGGAAGNGRSGSGGTGNTPPVTPAQGTNGGTNGTSPNGRSAGRGGGGAAAAASDSSGNASSPGPYSNGGPGGAGSPVTAVFGAAPQPFYPVPGPGAGFFSGGGGGGLQNDASYSGTRGAGGIGGGGCGASCGPANAVAGETNSGGGGGSAPTGGGSGAAGGSGIVLIRYKFQ